MEKIKAECKTQILEIVKEWEQKYGDGPTIFDIHQEISKTNQTFYMGMTSFTQELLIEGKLCTPYNFYKWATYKIDESYLSHSDFVSPVIDYLSFNERHIFEPRDNKGQISYHKIREMLLSKDEAAMNECEVISKENRCVFLDKSVNLVEAGDKIALASFERSGNTFSRKIIDTLTGVYSGGDMDSIMGVGLSVRSLFGEARTDDSVWIVKTHHPIVIPGVATDCAANRFIVLVRNPCDAFISLVNFIVTRNHSLMLDGDYHLGEYFQRAFYDLLCTWKSFYEFHIRNYKEGKLPVYFVRYEDLILKKEETLKGLFSFILKSESLEGTNIEKRIEKMIREADQNIVYALKEESGKIMANFDKFSEDQLKYIRQNFSEILTFFEYHKLNEVYEKIPFDVVEEFDKDSVSKANEYARRNHSPKDDAKVLLNVGDALYERKVLPTVEEFLTLKLRR